MTAMGAVEDPGRPGARGAQVGSRGSSVAGGNGPDRELVRRVRDEVAELLAKRTDAPELAGAGSGDGQELEQIGWTLIGEVLNRRAAAAMSAGAQPLDREVEELLARAVFDELFGYGGFSPLLRDPEVENIDAIGCDRVWVRMFDGTRRQVGPVAGTDAELVDLVRRVATRTGEQERRFDRGVPRLSVQLPDGSRLFAVMAVSRRPSVSIRRHRYLTTTLRELQRLGTVDAGLREFLGALVRARKNVLVAGGTNLGKTTMLRALAAEIPPHERLVTIEDAYELGLDRDEDRHPNVVALQAREPNIEGEGEITQAELVRWALRMSPDRVIVGEIRGSEVIPMCNAMSQGNDGSMVTIHASDSRGVFTKLAAYAVQAPERLPLEATNLLVANAVDVIVHLAWAGDVRVVSSVREVVDADGAMVTSNEIYRPGSDGRAVPGVPVRAELLEHLVHVGLDPAALHRPEGWWPR
jgi:pilus assembly protein CpaF